jgi:autotransporter-associated beta strand protein
MKKQNPTVRLFPHLNRWSWPAILSALLLCISAAHAQVLTWDPLHTHAANGSDGSGDWSTTGTKVLTNWVNGSGVDVQWDNVSSASIGAGGTASSIKLTAAVVLNNVVFNQEASGGYLVSGADTLTFNGGTNEVDNTAGPTVYHDLTLAGTVGFTKTGAGTLEFSGVIPGFTGLFHVADGELQLINTTWNYGSSDLQVDSGATLDMNKNATTVGALIGGGTVNNSSSSTMNMTFGSDGNSGEFDGVIENSGGGAVSVVKNGSGVEILGGTSTYTGTTTVSNGTLLVNGGIGAGAVMVESGAGFGGTGQVGGKVTYLSGALGVFTNGATPLAISGALVLNNNTVDLNLPASLGTGNYTLATYTATGSSGSFNATPVVLTGSISGIATVTNGSGQVVLNVQSCTAAGISQNPVNATAFTGNTATFTVTATGSAPTYDWQVNTGSGFADVTQGTGQGTATYTTETLTGTETGWQYQCIVGVACDSTSQTSTAATLTVVSAGGYSFRSIASGNWSSTSTWQQSPDGVNWSAASSTPFSGNSNILIQAGNTVTVIAPVTIDHTVIQAGGEVDVSGATLTVTGSTTPDCDVFGTLKLIDATGSAVTLSGTPSLVFENGSSFTSQLHTATAVPTATWAANSTCSIAPTAAGAAVPTGLTAQTFGNFVWNWPLQNGSVNLAGTLANMAGNLEVTAGSTLCLTTVSDATTDTFTIGGAVKVHGGNGKLAIAGGSPTGKYTLLLGAGLIMDATGTPNSTIDWGNNKANAPEDTVEFTGNSQFTLSANSTYDNPQNVSYEVNAGHTLSLSNSIALYGGATFMVNGTLDFDNAAQITAGTNAGSLTCTGELVGNGTNELTTGLPTIAFGGTLDLPNLPALASGQSFVLFGGATTSTGSFTIIPSTPGAGLAWSQSLLDTAGTLGVATGGGGGSTIKITSVVLSGSNLTLTFTGGTPSTAFNVIGASNLTTARSSWTVVNNGTTDGSGNASIEITGATGSGTYNFYAIQQ